MAHGQRQLHSLTDRIWVDEEVCGQAGQARLGSPALLLRTCT